MDNLLKKETAIPYLIPSSEIFRKLLDSCIESWVADLVIQEWKWISIITATKDTKTLENINDKINDMQDFIIGCLRDILKDDDKVTNFMDNETISEVNVGINYNFGENSDSENKPKIVRLRCTCIKELRGFQINIRIGNVSVPDYTAIWIPEEFRQLFEYKDGLILVAGPTGSGKTTTINALLKDVLAKNHKHLLTLEDPVEYVYNDDDIKWLVTYREQWTNFKNFFEGIKNSLRLSPNIIMIWEIRDAETANAVLEAVLGWHLVISTLHTSSVVWTVQKFVKWAQWSGNSENISVFWELLRGIMIQKLIKVPWVNWKKTTVAIREILYWDKKISNAIKHTEWVQYPILKNRMNDVWVNSISMNKYLISLYEKGILTSPTEVFENSNDIDGLLTLIDTDKIKFDKIFANNSDKFEEEYAKYKDK